MYDQLGGGTDAMQQGQSAIRPALLTVDDDPQVLRAIERDLRRHFGRDYRVVGADSGDAALDALDELQRRDEPVALLLADQRMPHMTGVEFLEQARDRVPDAKRVLLTAYADTEAAIRAINTVRLDYYLLKPWDPPEEHLYPVRMTCSTSGEPGSARRIAGCAFSGSAGRRPRTRCATSWPAIRSPTGGSTSNPIPKHGG